MISRVVCFEQLNFISILWSLDLMQKTVQWVLSQRFFIDNTETHLHQLVSQSVKLDNNCFKTDNSFFLIDKSFYNFIYSNFIKFEWIKQTNRRTCPITWCHHHYRYVCTVVTHRVIYPQWVAHFIGLISRK